MNAMTCSVVVSATVSIVLAIVLLNIGRGRNRLIGLAFCALSIVSAIVYFLTAKAI